MRTSQLRYHIFHSTAHQLTYLSPGTLELKRNNNNNFTLLKKFLRLVNNNMNKTQDNTQTQINIFTIMNDEIFIYLHLTNFNYYHK